MQFVEAVKLSSRVILKFLIKANKLIARKNDGGSKYIVKNIDINISFNESLVNL